MAVYPRHQLAQQIVLSCKENGITQVVVSPGSRNAPLIIGFNQEPTVELLSVVDERCAAFFALGIAQQTKQPIALICSSGSALLNYFPAVAEAFYSDIPLIIITADRPKHLIDIGDGQTIRQENVFGTHVLSSTNLEEIPLGNTDEYLEKRSAVAIQNAMQMAIKEKGPVHINVPFNEPLYETVDGLTIDSSFLKLTTENVKNPISLLDETPLDVDDLAVFAEVWNNSKKKIVLVGASTPDDLLQTQLEHIAKDPSVIVLVENTANVSHKMFVNSIDKLIFPLDDEALEKFQPEILLSLGGMIVSKKIKQQLRKYQPKHHWHVDAKRGYDSYHCLEHHFKISAQLFFSQFFFLTKPVKSDFRDFWLEKKMMRLKKHEKFVNTCEYSDFKVMATLIGSIPKNRMLQLSNSSIIRYAQLFDLNPTVHVFCNRGTSGIDGSTSTAVGASLASKKQTVLITGDISFLYDSNGLWNNYIPKNFRIIVVNNSGGGIFRFIPGPQTTNSLEYFETPHNLSAKELSAMHGFEYSMAENIESLENTLKNFYLGEDVPKLLEIFTPTTLNDAVLKSYFKNLKV
ncbi:MAG: 2-succinyl-5-enolpyruvyl-6-hydroxy-3-cyclohexene-1-carboxylic-acid synthase [Flavobacteriaceae bacterium]|nr:MAG: 2-succinyl-5-enolpyruvyl-6-hydroxy-3-cyclohexene-1-carboxylic-acid synthase [Flavobacteriaceae bacterium]